MALRIQLLLLLSVAFAGCAADAGPAYRGNDGRSGEYDGVGVVDLQQIVWKQRLDAPIDGSPAIAGNTVYVATRKGVLAALDTGDGTVRWDTDLGAPAFGTPVVMKRRVLVGTDHGLEAVDREGAKQWAFETGAIEAAPLVLDAVAYVGTRSNRALAIDAVGGSLIWEAITAGPIVAAPVRVGDDVVFGSTDGGVYCLDRATGEPRWTWSAGAPVRGLAAAGERVYVAAGSQLIALDGDSPESAAWRTDLGAIVETPPSLSGGVVIAGTGRGELAGVDATDGSPLFKHDLGSPIRGDIAVTAERLVVPATKLGLEVVDRAGKELWHFRTDDVVAGAVPRNNRLYVTDTAGSVYVLE